MGSFFSSKMLLFLINFIKFCNTFPGNVNQCSILHFSSQTVSWGIHKFSPPPLHYSLYFLLGQHSAECQDAHIKIYCSLYESKDSMSILMTTGKFFFTHTSPSRNSTSYLAMSQLTTWKSLTDTTFFLSPKLKQTVYHALLKIKVTSRKYISTVVYWAFFSLSVWTAPLKIMAWENTFCINIQWMPVPKWLKNNIHAGGRIFVCIAELTIWGCCCWRVVLMSFMVRCCPSLFFLDGLFMPSVVIVIDSYQVLFL